MATLTRAVYKSKSKGLRVQIRPERQQRHPTTGDVIDVTPRIYAEFGVFGPEQDFYNQLTGEMDRSATIIGGYYDVDAMAAEKGWDDDVKAQVIRELDRQCQQRPELIQRIDYIVQPAAKPWPTYDNSDPDQIVEIAKATGTAALAAAYERENANRPDLLERLDVDAEGQPAPEVPEPVVAVASQQAPSDDLTRITL